MDNSFWLTPRDHETLRSLFEEYSGVRRVRIFGSRAKWNYRKWSDIDMAIEGEYDRVRLLWAFDESSLPYFVDILDPAECRDPAIIEHIDRVGKVIYEKE